MGEAAMPTDLLIALRAVGIDPAKVLHWEIGRSLTPDGKIPARVMLAVGAEEIEIEIEIVKAAP